MLKINRRHNLRDLGGFPVGTDQMIRNGVLYRSGNLGNLSKKDSQKLIRNFCNKIKRKPRNQSNNNNFNYIYKV